MRSPSLQLNIYLTVRDHCLLLRPADRHPAKSASYHTTDPHRSVLAVFKEGLRFYPPVAGEMPRVVPKGGATIAGQFVPHGTVVAAAQYAMNHAPRNFADSFSFQPERFLTPDKFPTDNFDVLQPFSTGPRNCVGKNLAYAEMRTLLARLVWNFDLELTDPEDNWMDQKVFFLWTKPPLSVKLTPVQR